MKGVGAVAGGAALLVLSAISSFHVIGIIAGAVLAVVGFPPTTSRSDRTAGVVTVVAGVVTAAASLIPGLAVADLGSWPWVARDRGVPAVQVLPRDEIAKPRGRAPILCRQRTRQSRAWVEAACRHLVTITPGLGADPLACSTRASAKAGDFEGSAALSASWLDANAGAPGSPHGIRGLTSGPQPDLRALLEASRRFLASAKGVPGGGTIPENRTAVRPRRGSASKRPGCVPRRGRVRAPASALITAFLLPPDE